MKCSNKLIIHSVDDLKTSEIQKMCHFTYGAQMESLHKKVLKDFGSEMKKYKNIKVLVSHKHCKKYSVVTINCANLDKNGFSTQHVSVKKIT